MADRRGDRPGGFAGASPADPRPEAAAPRGGTAETIARPLSRACAADVQDLSDRVVRASSMVENLNSRLRNYFFLWRLLGADSLTLLQFFLNHRRYLRSEVPNRMGKSPLAVADRSAARALAGTLGVHAVLTELTPQARKDRLAHPIHSGIDERTRWKPRLIT